MPDFLILDLTKMKRRGFTENAQDLAAALGYVDCDSINISTVVLNEETFLAKDILLALPILKFLESHPSANRETSTIYFFTSPFCARAITASRPNTMQSVVRLLLSDDPIRIKLI